MQKSTTFINATSLHVNLELTLVYRYVCSNEKGPTNGNETFLIDSEVTVCTAFSEKIVYFQNQNYASRKFDD